MIPGIVFWSCALFGTALFILRAVTAFFAHWDEVSHDDFDTQGWNAHHEINSTFKLFTLHSLSGFFMMFGWTGLACLQQLSYKNLLSLIIAFFAGVATMFLTALIFKGAMMLVSTGSRFDIKQTVGVVGTVYTQIPQNGIGKIQIDVDGVTREVLARSVNQCKIESFKLIKVVQIVDNEVVLVKEVNS